jgi:hypothetical protein
MPAGPIRQLRVVRLPAYNRPIPYVGQVANLPEVFQRVHQARRPL